MARSRQSLVTDLLEIASRLPWKVSLGIAAISLLALHLVAAAFAPPPTVTNPADLGSVVIHQAIHVGAFFDQFVVPPVFLIGAAVSYFKRSRSIRLLDETRSAGVPVVASLTWRQFERLVAEGFRQRGFTVTEKGGAAPDGGVDLIIDRGTERFLVQCKQWRAQQVPVTIVRELYAVMAAEHAAGGYVVTSGRFTQGAIAFAAGRNIELIARATLPAFLGQRPNGTVRKIRAKTCHMEFESLQIKNLRSRVVLAQRTIFAASDQSIQSVMLTVWPYGRFLVESYGQAILALAALMAILIKAVARPTIRTS